MEIKRAISDNWVEVFGLAMRVLANSYQPRAKYGLFLLLLWWLDEEEILFGEVTE